MLERWKDRQQERETAKKGFKQVKERCGKSRKVLCLQNQGLTN